jgi:AraC-like DNA-binding protein
MGWLRADARILFDPVPFADAHLGVQGVGLREDMDACIVDRPSGTAWWLLMVFTSEVEVQVDEGRPPQRCAPGTAVVWRPRQLHWFGNRDRPWSHTWLHCSGSFIAEQVRATRLPVGRPIPGDAAPWLERCVDEVHVELRDQARPDRALVCNAIQGFLRRLGRASGAGDGVPAKWLAVRRHLDERYREPIALADLARIAGCTTTHLCDAFARHFGVSPYRYLLGLRLNHARMLLLDRSFSIRAVAEAVGYRDLRQFTKLFGKRYGMPPTRMRELS